MTARAAFKQAEVTKAIKGVVAAGMKPSGIRIDPTGAIVVMFGEGSPKAANSNPWDEELQ